MSLKDDVLRAAKADSIPAGAAGVWVIRKSSFTKGFSAERAGKLIHIPAGNYTSLYCYTEGTLMTGGDLVMHDVPEELNTHLGFMLRAHGRVLITGLGLGCVTRGCLANPAVEHVTVIERDRTVLQMVAPYMPKARLSIIQADAVKWCADSRRKFDCAWHDLWVEDGEPHLQVQHGKMIREMVGRVSFQGAWAMPREMRRLFRNVGMPIL